MELTLLPAGKFTMVGAYLHEILAEVTLTKPFSLGAYQVTQEQYEKVMGGNLSDFTGAQHPVEMVSWDDAVEFCRK